MFFAIHLLEKSHAVRMEIFNISARFLPASVPIRSRFLLYAFSTLTSLKDRFNASALCFNSFRGSSIFWAASGRYPCRCSITLFAFGPCAVSIEIILLLEHSEMSHKPVLPIFIFMAVANENHWLCHGIPSDLLQRLFEFGIVDILQNIFIL